MRGEVRGSGWRGGGSLGGNEDKQGEIGKDDGGEGIREEGEIGDGDGGCDGCSVRRDDTGTDIQNYCNHIIATPSGSPSFMRMLHHYLIPAHRVMIASYDPVHDPFPAQRPLAKPH